MRTSKTMNVVMLPTQKEQTLYPHLIMGIGSKDIMVYKGDYGQLNREIYINQHLYITDKEQIKDQDWFVNDDGLWQCTAGIIPSSKNPRKVMATSDKDLLLPVITFKEWDGKTRQFLQIPESFLQVYADSKGKLSEIKLEGEKKYVTPLGDIVDTCYDNEREIFIPKLRADNTVIIHQTKAISMEDMYLNMQYYMEYCSNHEYITPQDWIENHKHF